MVVKRIAVITPSTTSLGPCSFSHSATFPRDLTAFPPQMRSLWADDQQTSVIPQSICSVVALISPSLIPRQHGSLGAFQTYSSYSSSLSPELELA